MAMRRLVARRHGGLRSRIAEIGANFCAVPVFISERIRGPLTPTLSPAGRGRRRVFGARLFGMALAFPYSPRWVFGPKFLGTAPAFSPLAPPGLWHRALRNGVVFFPLAPPGRGCPKGG
jgi:hypothetical protein